MPSSSSACSSSPERAVESLSPLLHVLDHALRGHQVPQGAAVDHVLHAGPPAGVGVPYRAIGVDRDPTALMHGPPDEEIGVDRVPARATWKSGMARRSGSKATHIRAEVPPAFTTVSSTNILRTSRGSAPKDPRTGPSLCTHLHIDV